MATAQESRPTATNCETAQNPAGGLQLVPDSTSDASPDTAVQLSRIETILDSIVRSLAPLAGAR